MLPSLLPVAIWGVASISIFWLCIKWQHLLHLTTFYFNHLFNINPLATFLPLTFVPTGCWSLHKSPMLITNVVMLLSLDPEKKCKVTLMFGPLRLTWQCAVPLLIPLSAVDVTMVEQCMHSVISLCWSAMAFNDLLKWERVAWLRTTLPSTFQYFHIPLTDTLAREQLEQKMYTELTKSVPGIEEHFSNANKEQLLYMTEQAS